MAELQYAERILDGDWQYLKQFFPEGWEEKAYSSKAVVKQDLNNFRSVEDVMRTLLVHIGQGHSLKETAVTMKQSGIVDISSVGISKRLKKADRWFKELCLDLLKENNLNLPVIKEGVNLRLFDGSIVSEPGKKTQWRLHYSFQIPSFTCDHFEITEAKGYDTGESFKKYPVKKNDYVIGDRGYATPPGIEYIASQGAYSLVRVNTQALPLFTERGEPFGLLDKLEKNLQESGEFMEWEVCVETQSSSSIKGRVCAIKKTKEAAKEARKKVLQNSNNKEGVREETLKYADYIILFTTFPKEVFSTEEILELYRWRWQIEIAFKRLKSIAEFGHLPKRDADSSKAWLYGKLFVALLVEKIMRLARCFSPSEDL